jgi:branched-chain amino acid transport system substrate-binding protein
MSIPTCGDANRGGLFRIVSSVILAFFIGASATTETWTDARAEEPIKVGLLLTYVGPTAVFARYEDKGARLLIDQINKNGGIKGRPIELVNYDTEGKPDRAGTLYRRLAEEDSVVAVIGPDSIFVLLGMSDIPTEVKVISVSSPGLYELVQPQKRKYVVSAQVATTFAGTLVLGYLKDKFNAKRVGMITTSDVIGQTIAGTVGNMASSFGMELVEVASQPASDRDLLPSLRKLAKVEPKIDALYVFGSGPFANIAMNQSELAGITVPIAYNGGNVIPELIKDLSPDTAKRTFLAVARSTVWSTLPGADRQDPTIARFLSDYRIKFGEEPTLPSAIGYDMALPIVDALQNVGTDREKLTAYIHDGQKISGAQGIEFKRTWADGYGSDPAELAVASVADGEFVFRGFLKDSLERIGFSKEDMLRKMRELKLIAE